MPATHRLNPRCRTRGVTLIEQVMALAVLAVLVTLATPPMAGLLARNRLGTAQLDLMAGLRHARELAVTRQQPVIVCPSTDGAHCRESTRWEAGWLVAEDRDLDGQPDHGALLVHQGAPGDARVLGSAWRYRVRFRPDGSAPGSNLTLTVCTRDTRQPAVAVVVSNAGRIRGARASTEDDQACHDTES